MRSLLHWDEVPETVPSGKVSKRALRGGDAALVRVAVKAGTVAGRHSHPFEQFVQVISGAGSLETEDGTARFRAGSLFHFPAETWHAATFDEDTILVETNLER